MNRRKDMNTRIDYYKASNCYNCHASKKMADDCSSGAYDPNLNACVWRDYFSRRIDHSELLKKIKDNESRSD